jgi:hypothetical protein
VDIIIPILGIAAGIIIPLAVFIWQYLEGKGKRNTILEISRNLDNPDKLEQLIRILDDRKKEPLDYRRGGLITFFVGVGLYLFGLFFLGDLLKGVGLLVGTIGFGVFLAGFLYPNTSVELTNAVNDYERK